ncbi:hypothetical protein BWK47_00960 [Synechocystis sp. CACIAM 05]|nr:hypothetical protein BWK47_00960 [Synechocystis sp. CACIAM 05]
MQGFKGAERNTNPGLVTFYPFGSVIANSIKIVFGKPPLAPQVWGESKSKSPSIAGALVRRFRGQNQTL